MSALRNSITRRGLYTMPLVFAVAGNLQAVVEHRKRVTRRLRDVAHACRWREGCLSRAYDRSPRNGGQSNDVVRIISVRSQLLTDITPEDVVLEGFSEMDVAAFVHMFRRLNRIETTNGVPVWRIEFDYVEPGEVARLETEWRAIS